MTFICHLFDSFLVFTVYLCGYIYHPKVFKGIYTCQDVSITEHVILKNPCNLYYHRSVAVSTHWKNINKLMSQLGTDTGLKAAAARVCLFYQHLLQFTRIIGRIVYLLLLLFFWFIEQKVCLLLCYVL